ncbi:hypothetical protein J6590_101490, partial [Homalodisca vitripennis]
MVHMPVITIEASLSCVDKSKHKNITRAGVSEYCDSGLGNSWANDTLMHHTKRFYEIQTYLKTVMTLPEIEPVTSRLESRNFTP